MKLRPSHFIFLLLLVVLGEAGQTNAQAPQWNSRVPDNRSRTASISGRVTVDGKPSANAPVIVAEIDPRFRELWPIEAGDQSQQTVFIKARTGEDGRYQIGGLAKGLYFIQAFSKAYVSAKTSPGFKALRSVTLDEGEARENVDLALVRGGVITGQVTDVEGRPLIGVSLQAFSLDKAGKPNQESIFNDNLKANTDDRGVYRFYGLVGGQYILAAGEYTGYAAGKRTYPQTYYPDVVEANQAEIIDVKEGAEVTNINIRFGAEKNTFQVIGRVVDAEAGQPVKQVTVSCMEAIDKGEDKIPFVREVVTDEEGGFKFIGMLSGRYEVGISGQGISTTQGIAEHYSEKTRIEVNDSDISGLEIKAIRGSTITGVVVLDGVSDPAVRANLRQVTLGLHVFVKGDSGGYENRGYVGAKISGDGSFQLSGTPPGKGRFQLWGSEFWIKRVERDGVEIKSAFEIRQGERITGVRIILIRPNERIRGHVEAADGKLPEGLTLQISANPIQATSSEGSLATFWGGNGGATADEKGRFVIENLAAGEYELTLHAMVRLGESEWKSVPIVGSNRQRVIVSGGSETQVRFTIGQTPKQSEARQ
jgi:protocatechuate 3,4-dioxygenase beta subunit